MSDNLNERQRRCHEEFSIISSQFCELMIKADAIEAPRKHKKKKQRRSQKKTEAEKSSNLQKAESLRAACKDLANTIRGVLKELGEDVDEDDAAGPSGPPAGNN